jgi:hypothetical protein
MVTLDSCYHLTVSAFRRRRQGWLDGAVLEWTSSRTGRLLLTARIRKMGSQAEGEAAAPPGFLLTSPTLTQLIRLGSGSCRGRWYREAVARAAAYCPARASGR